MSAISLQSSILHSAAWLTLVTAGARAQEPAVDPVPVPAPATEQVEPAEQPAPPNASAVQTSCDLAVRFLRSQQDADTGLYGSPAETAAVLEALALSPRAYTTADGRFVQRALDALLESQRADGAFAPEDAAPEVAREQTAAMLGALVAYPAAGEALGRALVFLGPGAQPPLHSEMDLERGRVAAEALLGAQADDGAWRGSGSVLESTARSLILMSGAHRALQAAEVRTPADVQPLPPFAGAERAAAEQSLARGAAFLVEQAGESGLWGAMGQTDAGITAMVTGALLDAPGERTPELQAAILRGVEHLRTLAKEDGSIHAGQLQSYVTSASILALAKHGDPADAERIAAARAYLAQLQADEGEGYDPAHPYYGGVGYGGDERPDMSNLQLALDAMVAAGGTAEDEAFRKALAFLQRSQNRSESNDLELEVDGVAIRPGDDGGAGYAPGVSKAGFIELADGTQIPRSYGSMTYGLLRGYLFAGLSKDDPRVEAALRWISEHYTLDLNPGFDASSDPAAPYQGLYYYFHSMAKALSVYGTETVTDAAGIEHPWRQELLGRLVSLQRPDGSWLNENSPRWYEGNPTLATAFAMLTIEQALAN